MSARRRIDWRDPAAVLTLVAAVALAAMFAGVFGSVSDPVVGSTAVVVLASRGWGIARKRRARSPKPKEPEPLIAYTNGLALGHRVSDGKPAWLFDQQLVNHTVILGAVGSGKTTTLLTILTDAVHRGLPVVAIDPKGSIQNFGMPLQDAAKAAGREFRFWTYDGGCWWNPLAYGDATELKDKLIGFQEFSEPHYQQAAERYLQTELQVLKLARPDKPPTLNAVVSLLDPPRLAEMLRYVPDEVAQRVGPYLASLTRDQQSAVMGLQSRLAVIAESEVGKYLEPAEQNAIDLYQSLCGSEHVVYFGLNSSRYGKLSAQLAAMLIQDLTTISGWRLARAERPLALIAIDEFSALHVDNLSQLLHQAREAGIGVFLSTQEMADLDRLAPGFRDQVLGIVGTMIAHRQSVPDSADLIARMIGTKTVWKYTEAVHRRRDLHDVIFDTYRRPTTLGSKREVEEFLIHPNVIKDLPTGRAVLITKTPPASARLVQVVPGPRQVPDQPWHLIPNQT